MPNVAPLDAFTGRSVPAAQFFLDLAAVTALKYRPGHGFFYQNLERGPLLYGLVRERAVNDILEFGAGRGYAALAMAAALRDADRPGRILSMDIVGANQPILTAFFENGRACRRTTTLSHLLAHCDPDLTSRVRLLRGDSQRIATRLLEKGLRFDLIYIDGDHRYRAVFFDFVAALKLLHGNGVIIFDDYGMRGVRRLVAKIAADFPHSCTAVQTDGCWPAFAAGNPPRNPLQSMIVLDVTDPQRMLQGLGAATTLRRVYACGAPLRTLSALSRRWVKRVRRGSVASFGGAH